MALKLSQSTRRLHRVIENKLQLGSVAETWLVRLSFSHGVGKSLEIGDDRFDLDLAPDCLIGVGTFTGPQRRALGRMHHLQRTLVSVQAQAQFVQMAGRPSRCMIAGRISGSVRRQNTLIGLTPSILAAS